MAGNYPDAPSWRMAWDKDGSTGFIVNAAGAVTELTAGQKGILNNEANDYFSASVADNGTLGMVFPEPRDIDGYWFNIGTVSGGTQVMTVEVSADTTNGLDGTWAQIGSFAQPWNVSTPAKPTFRTGVTSSTQLNKRGIRVRWPAGNGGGSAPVTSMHVYGEPVPGANPNRLDLWHPTLDLKLPPAFLDFGNVPRSSSEDRLFRVKNMSSVQTASAVRVAMDVLTDGAPSVPAQHTLSHGGGSFLAQVTIGTLSPGAISSPVTIRRVTPSNAQLGLWAFRVFAESTAWA